MPLIPQQDIVTVVGFDSGGDSLQRLNQQLVTLLETYPPCRIVSISTQRLTGQMALTAVIETI